MNNEFMYAVAQIVIRIRTHDQLDLNCSYVSSVSESYRVRRRCPNPMNAQVRANVAIVPQSPTLFSGTVRDNLIGGNPIREGVDMSDAALLETLRTCRLGALADKGLHGTLEVCNDNNTLSFLCCLLCSTFEECI